MKLAHCNTHANSDDSGLTCYRIRHDDGRPATQEEIWGEIERLRKALRWHIRVYRVADEAWNPESETDRLMALALQVPNANWR